MNIYSLKTGIWKNLDDLPHSFLLREAGKFLNESVYWMKNHPNSWKIVSFDIEMETMVNFFIMSMMKVIRR